MNQGEHCLLLVEWFCFPEDFGNLLQRGVTANSVIQPVLFPSTIQVFVSSSSPAASQQPLQVADHFARAAAQYPRSLSPASERVAGELRLFGRFRRLLSHRSGTG